MSTADVVSLMAALVIIVRLLTYRRRGSRYRPAVSLTAWGCIAGCTLFVARLLTADTPDTAWLAPVLVIAAVWVVATGGNLAHLFRPPWRL